MEVGNADIVGNKLSAPGDDLTPATAIRLMLAYAMPQMTVSRQYFWRLSRRGRRVALYSDAGNVAALLLFAGVLHRLRG